MTLEKVLSYLRGAMSKNLFEIMSDVNDYINRAAERADLAAWIPFVVGLVLVFAIGLFGYKLVKPLSALASGFVGYFIGAELYHVVIKQFFEDCPEVMSYILGGILAALFIFFGFVKFSYVLFVLGAGCAFCTVHFYFEDNIILAIGAAFLAGVLMITLLRTAFILLSSMGSGMLAVGLLSGLFPKVEAFEPSMYNWFSIGLILLLAFVFATFQFVTNRRRKEYIE